MGETTAISWTDHTFNPWWGCWKIAPECTNCYADATAARYSPGHWGRTAPRRLFGDAHWNEPRKWNRKAERDGVRRRVFVGSMCDWAEVHPDGPTNIEMDIARRRLWSLIDECRSLDWLLLTKRPEDARQHLPWSTSLDAWPHVWIGATAGTIESLRRIVPSLREIPAVVRFISCEPLLESISASEWDWALGEGETYGGINWLIVGDESGRKRRDAQLDWVRIARDAAARHGVAFHFKQWNTGEPKKVHLPVLDGERHAAFPTHQLQAARGMR